MSDLHDPEHAERLTDEAPDDYLRRREFLQRTALAAGLTTALGTVLPSETLVAEAARRQRRRPLPAPKNLPIDTFVVLMMENRSFDHYLGWLPGADGRQAGLTFTDKQGNAQSTRPLAPEWQGCEHPDPDHSWDGGRTQLNGGRCDGFLRSGDNDVFSISYYKDGDLGFIQDAAKTFTTFDRFHCSLMGSTLPNREYMHAATSYGMRDNTFPDPPGFPDTTSSGPVSEYYERCSNGTLPAVSFVDPNFGGSVGEGPGISADEHPHGDVRAGQAFMSDVVHAFMESPQFKKGALFIVYDEWGGFFDHVRPVRVPDERNSRDIKNDYGLMGFRIPAIAVSPYVQRGHVEHTIYGFESILKMISYRFALKPLNRRHAYAHNIARSFDWESKPRLDVPKLPDPPTVVSQPCPGGGSRDAAPRAKDHDLMDLVTSGYLDRMGIEYRAPRLEDLYRHPDSIRSAYRP